MEPRHDCRLDSDVLSVTLHSLPKRSCLLAGGRKEKAGCLLYRKEQEFVFPRPRLSEAEKRVSGVNCGMIESMRYVMLCIYIYRIPALHMDRASGRGYHCMYLVKAKMSKKKGGLPLSLNKGG